MAEAFAEAATKDGDGARDEGSITVAWHALISGGVQEIFVTAAAAALCSTRVRTRCSKRSTIQSRVGAALHLRDDAGDAR